MRTHTDWRAVLAAALCGIVVAMNVGKVPIAMPQLRAEFSLSLVGAGWVSSMVNALGVSLAILIGLGGDRIGALRMCSIGLSVSFIAGTAALFASTESALLASRFAEGAGIIAVAVSAPALLSAASSPLDRRFALGIWSAYLPGGVALVMLLAPMVVPLAGWRGLWMLTDLFLLLAAIAIFRARASYRLPKPEEAALGLLGEAKEALAQVQAWLLALAMTTWTIQHYALIIWLPTFLVEQRGYSPLSVSLLSSLMVLVNVPGNLLGGRLLQKNFRRGNLIAVGSVMAGLCGVGAFLDLFPDLLRYGLCLGVSFIGGLIPASVLSASASLARTPRQIGTLQGLFTQCGNIGPFVGPPMIAALVVASGRWSDVLIVTGSAAALGLALGLGLRRCAA